jgi:TonB family protein
MKKELLLLHSLKFKSVFICLFYFLPVCLMAQKPLIFGTPDSVTKKFEKLVIEAYNEGLEFYKNKLYEEAEGKFMISLLNQPHKDTYFARAAARQKLNDLKGYCSDLAHAAVYGDKEAAEIFKTECGTVKNVFVNEKGYEVNHLNRMYRLITYESKYDQRIVGLRLNRNERFVNTFYKKNDSVRVFTGMETMPEFPGGTSALYKLIHSRLVYPEDALKKGAQGTVYVKFVVEPDGSTTNFEVVQYIIDFPSMSEAALKACENLPRFYPALFDGQPARVYFNFPVKFKMAKSR